MLRQIKIQRTLLNTTSLNTYLGELNKKLPLSPEEEVKLISAARQGDQGALTKLIESNLRFVVSVAKQYMYVTTRTSITLEDLVQEGNMGLIRAAERFDETKGFKFISYAVWWIRQNIQSYISDNFNPVATLPANVNTLRTKVERINERFQQLYQRDATEDEILENIDSDNQRAAYEGLCERGGVPRKSFSIQDKISENEGNGSNTFESVLASDDEKVFNVDILSNAERRQILKDAVLSIKIEKDGKGGVRGGYIRTYKKEPSKRDTVLDRALEVFLNVLGLNDENRAYTLEECAYMYGITRERCRQLFNMAQTRLKGLVKKGELTIDMLGL